jgi:hypothetical protein
VTTGAMTWNQRQRSEHLPDAEQDDEVQRVAGHLLVYRRSRAEIWMRLPHVSSSMAMVEPVTLVGGMVNFTPSPLRLVQIGLATPEPPDARLAALAKSQLGAKGLVQIPESPAADLRMIALDR